MERRRNGAKMLLTLLLTTFVSHSSTSNVGLSTDYAGWRVLEVHLEGDDADLQTLNDLHNLEDPGYLQVLNTRRDRGVAEVAVSPSAWKDFREQQKKNEISFSTVIQDLSKKLDSDGPSLRADSLPRGVVTYDRFMNVDEILAHVEELPNQYPNKVTVKKVGDSVENRPLYLVTVTSNTRRNANKSVIFIDAGVHAREWISPAAALNLIGRLIESPSLTRNIEWQIMPLLNPDGYAYSWTNDRLWRKNRADVSFRCSGTDINRNFGYHWGESGSSAYPCSTIYKGSQAFSEPESRALRDAMLPIKDRIEAYITIHSYGQYILYPWGYTSQRDRYNDGQLFSVGEGMAKVIKRNGGAVFSVGSAAKLLYPAAGASDDWAAGELKIPLVYTLELRDEGAGGFVLPDHLILPAVNDAWVAVKYLAKQVIRKEGLRLDVDTATAPAEPRTKETTATKQKPQRTPVFREIVQASVFEDPVVSVQATTFREPIQTSVIRVPVNRRPPTRTHVNRRYYDSSEEDSSSEESSEESDEDRK